MGLNVSKGEGISLYIKIAADIFQVLFAGVHVFVFDRPKILLVTDFILKLKTNRTFAVHSYGYICC